MPQTVDVLIDQRDIPIAQLSERTGLSVERITAIVDGRWTPSPDERTKIANAIGVSVESVSWGHTMNPRNVRYHRYGIPKNLSNDDA